MKTLLNKKIKVIKKKNKTTLGILFLLLGLINSAIGLNRIAENRGAKNDDVIISADTENTSRPNVVIILADDMGYADLSGYGGVANTPNLDALASEGI